MTAGDVDGGGGKELNAGAPESIWNVIRRLQDMGEVGKRG